jgi:hypothetical protein
VPSAVLLTLMPPGSWRAFAPARHAALGFSEHAAPSLVFVLTGVVLGPELLDVLSVNLLAQFDPAVSVTLAVLGIFVGSGLSAAASHGRVTFWWVTGATLQGLITFGTVAAAMYLLLHQWGLPLPVDPLTGAAVLGLCSTVSAAVRETGSGTASNAARIADFDDLLLVALGAFAVAWLAGWSSLVVVVGLTLVAGVVIAVAGAALLAFSGTAPERSVFVTGTVFLLGGAAAYTGTSPLVSGCVAGLLWARMQRSVTALVDSDLKKLQHPLVVILLIIAGASIQFTYQLLWLAAPLVLFRLTGKLIGSLVTARLFGLPAGLLATYLAPPGLLGIALALNIQQVLSTGDTLLVSAVTASTVAAELLALVLVIFQPLALSSVEAA